MNDEMPELPLLHDCPLRFPEGGCDGKMHILERVANDFLVRARMQCDTCQSIIHAIYDPATREATVLIDARHDPDAEGYLDA